MAIKRMSHAVNDTRYHLVWAPKYRKWILKEKVRDEVKELFEEILAVRDCEIEEMLHRVSFLLSFLTLSGWLKAYSGTEVRFIANHKEYKGILCRLA